jgi:signal transduction histidine kinase
MIFTSIRWRLQVWHGIILVAVLTCFGFTAYHVARDNLFRRIDQELDRRAFSPFFRPDPPGRPPERHGDGPPEGPRRDPAEARQKLVDWIKQAAAFEGGHTNAIYYVLWQTDGSVIARSQNAPEDVPGPDQPFPPNLDDGGRRNGHPPRPGPPGAGLARTRGEWREHLAFLPFGGCLLVGRSIAPELASMRLLALWLGAAGCAVLAFGLAGGWWLSTRAIQPIKDISATAMKIASGDLSQRINAADTESELGRLAAILNSTFARLEAAFAHQARFTADASHELRTPVSVILTQTQSALSRDRPSAEYREALEACQRAAQRMRALTDSLLELARLDAGQEPMKREAFDLARVMREAVELVRPLAAQRAIELRCDLPTIECVGDAERIGQVATNLLSNAIHFNRDHGEVRISAQTDNGTALMAVADTGVGIPAEDLPHLFERFYRVDKSRSRIQGRTGLGLAICKAILDAQGGSIEVSSQLDAGTTFTVKLPLKQK